MPLTGPTSNQSWLHASMVSSGTFVPYCFTVFCLKSEWSSSLMYFTHGILWIHSFTFLFLSCGSRILRFCLIQGSNGSLFSNTDFFNGSVDLESCTFRFAIRLYRHWMFKPWFVVWCCGSCILNYDFVIAPCGFWILNCHFAIGSSRFWILKIDFVVGSWGS